MGIARVVATQPLARMQPPLLARPGPAAESGGGTRSGRTILAHAKRVELCVACANYCYMLLLYNNEFFAIFGGRKLAQHKNTNMMKTASVDHPEQIHVRRDHNVFWLDVDVPEWGFTRHGVNKCTYP